MVQAFDPRNFEARAENGIVAASHPLAARAGIEVMKRGGNAVDAAIGTAFALTVVDPCMCSIAGRGEMNIYLADKGSVQNIEFVSVCGEKAKVGVYEVLPTAPGSWWNVKDDANNVGYKSISVPTALAGLCSAQESFGAMELGEVVEPSVELAEKGFEVDSKLEANIDSDFPKLTKFPATARILCPGGRPLMRGETLRMRDYAKTLRCIAEEGPEVFYKGDLAEAIIKDMDRNGGLVTRRDMEAYEPNFSDPLKTTYRGYQVISGSPDCSGGRLVLQSLNVLENFDIAAYGDLSSEYVHILSEVFKQAFADRLQFEADPRFTEVPAKGLLSKDYARELKGKILMDKASSRVFAGDPWKYERKNARPMHGPGLSPGSQGTTHLCSADKDGNMVALTETLCGGFGSGVTIPGTGVIMNNGMYWFNPVAGTANSIQPGKRHVSNMAATLVLKDGEAVLATGAAGGRRILTTVTEVLTRVLDFGQGVKSLFPPRFHIEDQEPIQVEQSFYEEVPLAHSLARSLSVTGHKLETLPSICIGCIIARDVKTGVLHGAAEPRNLRPGSVASC